jgi:hypothetical protein
VKAPKTVTPHPSPHPDWKTDDWCTPPEVMALVRELGPVALDPCGNRWSHEQVRSTEALLHEGLRLNWCDSWRTEPGDLVWVNPPYSNPGPWVERCIEAAAAGRQVLLLIPVGTSKACHLALRSCSAVLLWAGRIKFWRPDAEGNVGPGPGSPNVEPWILYWGHQVERFSQVFGSKGTILRTLNPQPQHATECK